MIDMITSCNGFKDVPFEINPSLNPPKYGFRSCYRVMTILHYPLSYFWSTKLTTDQEIPLIAVYT